METTSQIASCTANLILFDMDASVTTADDCRQYTEKYSITIRIIFDSSDEQIDLVELETQPSEKFDRISKFDTIFREVVFTSYFNRYIPNVCESTRGPIN